VGIFLFAAASGAHPASCPVGVGGSFLGGGAAGAWVWPLGSVWCRGRGVGGAVPPLPQCSFVVTNVAVILASVIFSHSAV
jgi:hypothetical protein